MIIGFVILVLADGPAAFAGIPIMIVLGFVAGAVQRVAEKKQRHEERRAARKGARRS